jgi:hypothetical protein
LEASVAVHEAETIFKTCLHSLDRRPEKPLLLKLDYWELRDDETKPTRLLASV